ncbi:HNH endonuclease [Rhizobium lusitanum]|uniref:HNH endonuclease n=1 Tax=Rhizobium lusitanum TaxID=293958 RepID=A0A1C3VR60_9HYPH|nr:HNH endonuclease [Rhizobium lusitanum]SCB30271.1 HNH endonuclease [Rhizobium lusitanum]
MFVEDRTDLDAERLRELVNYDPSPGIFTRKSAPNKYARYKVGDVAGSLSAKGYIRICVDGNVYPAHRLAWLYMMGEWPSDQIDHKDLNKSNNAWDNLRLATNGQNKANSPVYKTTKSGLKGAYWEGNRKGTKNWSARIRHDGRLRHIGYFYTAEEAHKAYGVAAKALHGEFSRV